MKTPIATGVLPVLATPVAAREPEWDTALGREPYGWGHGWTIGSGR